jgi:hypothetical protein
MADWKDFVEDNRERAGQLLDSLEARYPSRAAVLPPLPPPISYCPVCLNAFYSPDALEDHIRQVHGPQHVYLRVNGTVVREVAWAERGIRTIGLVLLGYSNAAIEIEAGATRKLLTAKTETALLGEVPPNFEGEIRLDVQPNGGRRRAFTIYCRSLPEFRQADLDRKIWDLQQGFIQDGSTPDLKVWREFCGAARNSSSLEERYVNGFFEYTMGFALERRGQTKAAKEHFEDAFGYLLPFRTLLAEQAQCILGLKMNCFAVLQRCGDDSLFSPARVFFLRYPDIWKQPKSWPVKDSFGLYADDFTLRLVRVVATFYKRDDAEFWQGIEALKFHPVGEERNNLDKLQLMQARAFVKKSDEERARESYRLLRYNPYFGFEAEEFLKNV